MAHAVADCWPMLAVLSVGFGLKVVITPLSEACSRGGQEQQPPFQGLLKLLPRC